MIIAKDLARKKFNSTSNRTMSISHKINTIINKIVISFKFGIILDKQIMEKNLTKAKAAMKKEMIPTLKSHKRHTMDLVEVKEEEVSGAVQSEATEEEMAAEEGMEAEVETEPEELSQKNSSCIQDLVPLRSNFSLDSPNFLNRMLLKINKSRQALISEDEEVKIEEQTEEEEINFRIEEATKLMMIFSNRDTKKKKSLRWGLKHGVDYSMLTISLSMTRLGKKKLRVATKEVLLVEGNFKITGL